jgi:hypothetical protein
MSIAAQAREQLKAEMLLYPQQWIIVPPPVATIYTMPSISREDLP